MILSQYFLYKLFIQSIIYFLMQIVTGEKKKDVSMDPEFISMFLISINLILINCHTV